MKANKAGLREKLERFSKRFREKHEPSANEQPSIDTVTGPSIPPAETEPVTGPSPKLSEQSTSQMGLWGKAAASLNPGDRDTLERLIKSKREYHDGPRPVSLANEVDSTLSRAKKLKEEDKEATWRPIVEKIISGALVFKSLGDAAVAFDKSGYAALGWSVVSFGLQLAVNAEATREFVLSSSEVITRFMVKYQRYEDEFRCPEAGEDFDHLLTNAYKAILLYVINLDKYLGQSEPERFAHAINKAEDQTINSSKKAVDAADAEVRDWLVIIMHKQNNNSFSWIQSRLQDHSPPQISKLSQDCLKSLAFQEMEDRFHDIEHATEGTCTWLLRHQKYRAWTDDHHGMLCIKGKPGSGKSTLLHYAIADAIVTSKIPNGSLIQQNESLVESSDAARAQPEPNVVTLSFFFHDRGTDLQKTPLGLFRSLLHQLLRHIPDTMPEDLLTTFQDRMKNMGEVGEKWVWKWREVRHFYEESLQKALESHQVFLFIDALDEYGEIDANELIKSFNSWIQACPPQAQLHICFTCRHFPLLDLPQELVEIRLEEENKDDISTYVQAKLSAWSNKENLATIWMDITDRASGVFLWAFLIVPDVLYLESRGENWKKIKRQIENTPQDLTELYRCLLKKVETDPNAFRLIKWICFSMEPLTLNELRWAMIVDPEYSDQPASLRRYEDTEDFATDCEMMEKKLNALSCGLAEAIPSSRVVQFIHQSVKDFFVREGLEILLKSQNPAGIESNEADLESTVHYQLCRTCIRYLSTEEIIQSELPFYQLKRTFPLLRYATVHWIAHVQQSFPQTDLLQYFSWPSERIVQLWSKFRVSENTGRLRRPRVKTSLLHVASQYQLMGLVKEIMQSKELLSVKIDARDNMRTTPLWWAALTGYEAVVRLLVDNGAQVNPKGGVGENPLCVASMRGNEKIVQILLEKGADVNAGENSEALIIASGHGHEQIVRMLVEKGADMKARTKLPHNFSALEIASGNCHVQTVRILLRQGADMKLKRSRPRNFNALEMASWSGHEQIVRILLEQGADVNNWNIRDDTGALELASKEGHKKIVQILLEYDAKREKAQS